MGIEIPEWVKYELAERYHKGRRWVNDNPKAVWGITSVSVFILLLILISILSGGSRPEVAAPKKAWFYDLNTGKLFVGRASRAGPIKAPSGSLENGEPAGVKANVFTYANEPNENELIIGYMEKPDPNVTLEGIEVRKVGGSAGRWGEGKLVRTVEDPNWVAATSHKGRNILREATKRDSMGRIARYHAPK
jgi:hypothetical protein